MVKSATAFRTISEVSDELEVPQHVLRFWETKFPQVRPLKRGGGRRYYRPEDVAVLRNIQRLLYSEGYTIKGAQRVLRDPGGAIPPGLDEEDEDDFEALEAAPVLPAPSRSPPEPVALKAPAEPVSVQPRPADPAPIRPAAPTAGPVPAAAAAPVPVSAPVATRPATPGPIPAVGAVPSPPPAAPAPVSAQASVPQASVPQATGMPPATAPAPVVPGIPPLSAWHRRELTELRAELSELRAILRRAGR
jgi:DNA-binding transcriptional MerR regulator